MRKTSAGEQSLTATLSAALPFWSVLTPAQRQLLLGSTTVQRCTVGARVGQTGSLFHGLLVLQSGSLRAYIDAPDGREATLFTLRAVDVSVLCLSAVRDGCSVELNFEALQDTVLLCLNESAVFVLYHTVPRVQQYIMDASFGHISSLLQAVSVQALYPLKKRLALLLLERAELAGGSVVRATHEELARCLRSAREMVSLELEALRKAGVLSAGRGRVTILDAPALERISKLEQK